MKFSVLFVAFYLLQIIQLNAQSVGPNTPSNYSTSGSGAAWGNLSGVQAIDNSPAYVDLAQYPTCNNFMCYRSNKANFNNFGFNVPLNATIVGIEAAILQRVSSPGGGIHDSILTLGLNGSALGINKASALNWFDTLNTQTYGGPNDLWGTTLTPNDVNDATFGLYYEITNTSYDQTASVDYMTMTVYYQIGTSIQAQSSKPWYINFENDNLVIDISNIADELSLKLFDATGRMVYHKDYNSNYFLKETINSQGWKSGLYYLQLEGKSGISFRKKVLLLK